jgi:hypothetical protein
MPAWLVNTLLGFQTWISLAIYGVAFISYYIWVIIHEPELRKRLLRFTHSHIEKNIRNGT